MTLLLILFFLFMIANLPLAFTIAIPSIIFFIENNIPVEIVVQRMVSSTQSFPLLAVPFFILAGNLMNETGITFRLIKFAVTLTGHMKGGLAQVSVILSALMGGVSGSATADAAMEARILGPDMLKKGYSKGYTASIIGMSSLITATIPPSVGLILYGFVGEVSIGKLFLAGIIPGVLMTFVLMGMVSFTAKKRNYRAENDKAPSLREIFLGFKENIFALIFPLILIIGIRFGFFTPSEAGAFAVVYAFFIGVFIYKELTFDKLVKVLQQSAVDIGIVMFIIMCSSILGYALVTQQIPQKLAVFIVGISNNPKVLLLIILGFLFIVGMFMESTVNVLLLTPIFLPIVQKMGIDPVHFGILMMTIVTMGGMTPPVGVIMYTVCSLLDCPTEEYITESLPFIAAVVGLVIIIALVPEIVMFIPNLVFNK